MINKDAANALFERNACLVVDRDVIPEKVAIELTSRGPLPSRGRW